MIPIYNFRVIIRMREELTKLYIGRRVWATFIDYTLVWSFTIFYIFMAGERSMEGTYTVSGWPVFIPVLFWFLYIVVAEHYVGETLGHLICGIKVESVSNDKITIGRTLIRRMSDIVEIAWCFGIVAYIIAFNTRNNQRLGDILAKTCVIGKNDVFHEIQFDFEK
jgi:uncharacterized RDD family membrane protein YckC